MKYDKIHLIYFSPTHTSARIARAVAEGTGITRISVTDLTTVFDRLPSLAADVLTVLAAPVYGGRVAETAMERFASLKGAGSPVITLVLYGNRDYEDALLELTDFTRRAGFVPVGAGAFVGEHSYSRSDLQMPLAEGRPDAADLFAANRLGRKCMEKLGKLEKTGEWPVLSVAGRFPYKVKGASTPAAPEMRAEVCSACGHCCEICPVGAVTQNADGTVITDKMMCIKCCACVKECPAGARYFDTPYTAMLFQHFKERREPEIFL